MECSYERQLFGFSRDEFKGQLEAAVEQTIRANVARASEALIESLSSQNADLESAALKLKGIERLFSKNAEEPLRRLRNKIDESLDIPATILLPEDEDMAEADGIEERLRKAREETEKARTKALAAAAGVRLLRRELTRVRHPDFLKAFRAARDAADLLETLPFPKPKRIHKTNLF